MHSHPLHGLRYTMLAIGAILISTPSTLHAQMKSVPASSAELDATRAALAKYSDPVVAVRDGYLSTLACVDFSEAVTDGPVSYPPGAMGVHFLNASYIGPNLDPKKPQILIYEPVGDKLVLAGAEWFVPVQVAGNSVPSIFGQQLAGPMDGHEPIIPASLRHYDLHVWLWKDNPKGMFTSTNSALKCTPGSTYTLDMSKHHAH